MGSDGLNTTNCSYINRCINNNKLSKNSITPSHHQLYAFKSTIVLCTYIFYFIFFILDLWSKIYIYYIDNRAVTGCCCCLFHFFLIFVLCKFIIKKKMRKLLQRILMVNLCGYVRKYNL